MRRVRQYLAGLGLVVAGAGVALDHSLAVWVAIALLGTSLLLRLIAAFRNRRPRPRPPSPTDSLSPPEDG